MATSLGSLITLVQQRANAEKDTFIGQQEIISYINNSLAELYDILTTTYEDYDSHTYMVTLTGSNNILPMLSDVNKVRLVEFQYITGGGGSTVDNFYPINVFQMPQRNRYGNSPINLFLPFQIASLTYRVMGNEILIEPVAASAGTYRIWYTQKWQNLVNLTDELPQTMDSQAWSEYAVVDACIKIWDKRNIDATGFRQEKMELKDRIVSAAKNRTLGQPKQMVNVRRRSRYGIGGGFNPGGNF